MRRKWIEGPTEEEIAAEETQEYRVPGVADEVGPEVDEDFAEAIEEGEDVEVEYEEFEEEEFIEDDEYFEDDGYVDEPETEEARLESEPEAPKPYEPLAEKLKEGWAAAVVRVRTGWGSAIDRTRKIELPDKPEKIDSTLVLSIAAIALVALTVGIGAFFMGKGSGDSVDQARLEGQAAGAKAGAIKGASGYGAAFKDAREAAFEKAYVPAYRKNFKRVYEDEGLPVPSAKDIQVPEP